MVSRWNHLVEPVPTAGAKPFLTEFGIDHRLDSCLTSFLLRFGGDGSVYVGSFRYGRSSGPAVMTYASGDTATGVVSNAF